MRGLRIMDAFIHPGGGYHSGISPHRIKISRRELREGKLNSPLLWVSVILCINKQEWWAMVNKTPWGIHRCCNHPLLSSHSRLFCPESSNNRKFGSGVNQWVTGRGTRWWLWWRKKWGWLVCPPRSSLRCSGFHGRFMFFHVLLGTRSEFTPRAAGGIILNGGRCDLADICNRATLRRTEEDWSLRLYEDKPITWSIWLNWFSILQNWWCAFTSISGKEVIEQLAHPEVTVKGNISGLRHED